MPSVLRTGRLSSTTVSKTGEPAYGAWRAMDKAPSASATRPTPNQPFPDGKRVAVWDFVDGPKMQLVILDAVTGAVQQTYEPAIHSLSFNEGQNRLSWAPDKRGLIFIIDNSISNVSNLWEQPVGAPGSKQEPLKQITDFTSLQI